MKKTNDKTPIWIQNKGKYFFKYSESVCFFNFPNNEMLFTPSGVENDTLCKLKQTNMRNHIESMFKNESIGKINGIKTKLTSSQENKN